MQETAKETVAHRFCAFVTGSVMLAHLQASFTPSLASGAKHRLSEPSTRTWIHCSRSASGKQPASLPAGFKKVVDACYAC